MNTLRTVYLIAWPVYLIVKYIALYADREYRLRNHKTRYTTLVQYGEGIVFDYRTLLWLYLLVGEA